MPRIIEYGKTSKYVGKPLLELLANLPNWGVGRVVKRSVNDAYWPGETHFMVVRGVEVWTHPEHGFRFGRALVDEVIRNELRPDCPRWYNSVYKADWKLIPKDEVEDSHPKYDLAAYKEIQKRPLPRTMNAPPLMDLYLKRRLGSKLETDPKTGTCQVPLDYQFHYTINELRYRVAEKGDPDAPPPLNHRLIDMIDPKYLKNVPGIDPDCKISASELANSLINPPPGQETVQDSNSESKTSDS